MCLIIFSFDHPKYKLVLAANRDEFYARDTQPASFWKEYPSVLAGRDLEANGTWMGITNQGKIAMVTNYRDLKNLKSNAPSRGKLVSDFLVEKASPEAYLKQVELRGSSYNGFNLLVGNPETLWYYSNFGHEIIQINHGLHGLSNHLLDTEWPKVKRAKSRIQPLLGAAIVDREAIFETFYDDARGADSALPDTGVGIERERMLSPVFIKSSDYGSRSTTIILVDKDNHAIFSERVYQPPAYTHETRTFEFDLSGSLKAVL